MAQSIILTENLCKSFGDREIVKMVNLDVRAGEIYGLIGPAGSGKTTTLLLLAGYYTPAAGTIRLCGRKKANLQRYKRHFGFLGNRTGFYELMTARANLTFFGNLYDIGKDELLGRVDSLLEYVGLTSVADKQVGTFTPGMVQRLGLAKALLHQPEILLLDEPLTQMDLQGVQLIRKTILRLAKEGRTVLISSHYFAPVQELCSTIGVMIDGELVYQGPPAELITGVKDSYFKYVVYFEREGLYSDEQIINEIALFERGIHIVDYTYDNLVVAGSFGEPELREMLLEVGVAVREICPLTLSDDEYYYQYCAQYQELRELTEGGGTDEPGQEIILDGFPLQDTE